MKLPPSFLKQRIKQRAKDQLPFRVKNSGALKITGVNQSYAPINWTVAQPISAITSNIAPYT
jgi:hypothetical protein